MGPLEEDERGREKRWEQGKICSSLKTILKSFKLKNNIYVIEKNVKMVMTTLCQTLFQILFTLNNAVGGKFSFFL